MMLVVTLVVALSQGSAQAQVQDASLLAAMQRYKDVSTVTAMVTRTHHNALLSDDEVDEGVLLFKAPDKMVMDFNGGTDRLLMNGKLLAITTDGKTQAAVGKIQTQAEDLITIFQHVFLGSQPTLDVSKVADVKVEKAGKTCTVTIVPVPEVTAKGKTRMQLFASAVFVVNLTTGDFVSLRMNEKGDNYTLYKFSSFTLNKNVDDSKFEL